MLLARVKKNSVLTAKWVSHVVLMTQMIQMNLQTTEVIKLLLFFGGGHKISCVLFYGSEIWALLDWKKNNNWIFKMQVSVWTCAEFAADRRPQINRVSHTRNKCIHKQMTPWQKQNKTEWMEHCSWLLKIFLFSLKIIEAVLEVFKHRKWKRIPSNRAWHGGSVEADTFYLLLS